MDWIGLDGLLYMSNIAPYNEKKRKKKKKKKPIMNQNVPLAKCKPKQEKKRKKSTHVADSVTVSMSGVFSLSFVSATVLHSGHTDLAITH